MKNGVTVVCAAYKKDYLDHEFGMWDSFKKQTYDKKELIIVGDNSDEIRDWYNKKEKDGEFDNYDVSLIDLPKNQGRYGLVGRNVGAMCAKYDRILFLDDDNGWDEEDYIEKLLKAEQETGKIPYSNLHLVGKREGSIYDRIKKTHLHHQGVDLGCILYNKYLFIKYGYFDDTEQKFEFDWVLINKIVNGEGEDSFIKVPVNLYYRHRRH